MTEPDVFDPDELAAAERLDRRIDALQHGTPHRDTPPEALWLHAAMRSDPPAALASRVETRREVELRRRWRPFRWVAAVMAYLFISQGIGNLVIGDWVAEGVGDAYSPHFVREGAFALIAAGIAVASGALHRRMAPLAVSAGTPLGLALGAGGIGEIGVFAAGAALHLTQGVVAIALAVTFWWYRRDSSDLADEEGA